MTDYGKRLIYDTAAQHKLVALARQRGSDFIPLDMITYILFNDTPAVDVREVVHAKWNYDGSCGNCGVHVLSNYMYFCPHCGADMREVENG